MEVTLTRYFHISSIDFIEFLYFSLEIPINTLTEPQRAIAIDSGRFNFNFA